MNEVYLREGLGGPIFSVGANGGAIPLKKHEIGPVRQASRVSIRPVQKKFCNPLLGANGE